MASHALEEKQFKHTQQSLAKLFGYSLSTINHALASPSQLGAIRKESKFFVLEDFQKFLYYWASVRNLEMEYYHNLITQKSWQELILLNFELRNASQRVILRVIPKNPGH